MSEYSAPSFDDAGINDFGVGVELFRNAGMELGQLNNPQNLQKLREISEFLDGHDDPIFLISSVIRKKTNPSVNNLDHLYGYVQLNKQKQNLMSQIDKLNSELKYYD